MLVKQQTRPPHNMLKDYWDGQKNYWIWRWNLFHNSEKRKNQNYLQG